MFYKILRWLFDVSAPIIGPQVPASVKTEDIEIKKGIKLRIYKPNVRKTNLLPTVIYYHGGGWIIGSSKAYDRVLRYISYKSNCIVVGVDYRKAPLYRFPVALDDSLFAYNWVIANAGLIGCNKNKIALMGDSAGGNLAALVQIQLVKTNKVHPKALALIYPAVSFSTKGLQLLKKDTRLLSKVAYCILIFCLKHYLGSLKKSKLKNISLSTDLRTLKKFPKMLIITANTDPLTESINQYTQLLRKAGVTVVLKHYYGAIHGFINFARFSKIAKQALDEIIAFLKGN